MLILTRVYQGIALLVAALVADAVLRDRDFGRQVSGGMVLVPLLLRLLLIK